MLKVRIRVRLGMLYYEMLIIALLTLVQTLFIIFLHRGMITVLQGGLLELDQKIALAIQNVLSGEITLPEPANPIQQFFMQMVTERMQSAQKTPDLSILRDENGKFK